MSTKPVEPRTLNLWALYLRASEEARRRGDRRTGTDHLLLALLDDPSVGVVLGVDLAHARGALDALDREALAQLGIQSSVDVPPLVMHTVSKKPRFRDVAQRDRLRMTPAAKKVLEDAVRPNRRKIQATAEQVLARILSVTLPDPAAVLLHALGVDASEVRRRLNSAARES